MVSFTGKGITRPCSVGLGAESILPDFPAKVQYLVLCFLWETCDHCQIFFSYSPPLLSMQSRALTQTMALPTVRRLGPHISYCGQDHPSRHASGQSDLEA